MKKYIIVKDLSFSDFMKDTEGNINIYNSLEDAHLTAGIYEFPEYLILEVVGEYKEPIE